MLTALQTGAMVFTALFTVLVPLGAMLWLWKRRGGSWSAFFVGAGTFLLFSMVLEQALHLVVLKSALGPVIQGSLWLTALYGGLAAGLFEETGRLAAFRFILKKQTEPAAALSYGLGHGGCEAALVTGLAMVSNLALVYLVKAGSLTDPAVTAMAETVAATPAGMFLWAALERVSAIVLHTANSVLVFAAVRRRKYALFGLAVLTHAGADFLAAIANAHLPIAATELLVLVFSILVVLLAARVYGNLMKNTENT